MANKPSKTHFIILVTSLVMMVFMPRVYSSIGEFDLDLGLAGWMGSEPGESMASSTCKGNIGECLGEEEFDMDSEINRRILATRRYISYGALRRNTVPCSHRGASYYNCRPGASANPYRRGCSRIARCRRG